MPRVRRKNADEYISDLDKSRIVPYRDCDLSYQSIADSIRRDPITRCAHHCSDVARVGDARGGFK